MSGLFESKSWLVESYEKKFCVKDYTLTVRFKVRRRVNKWLWNFLKTDTIFYENSYNDAMRERINEMFGNKCARKVELQIEMEMTKLKLKHVR